MDFGGLVAPLGRLGVGIYGPKAPVILKTDCNVLSEVSQKLPLFTERLGSVGKKHQFWHQESQALVGFHSVPL